MISPIDFLVNDAKTRQPSAASPVDSPRTPVATGLQADDASLTEIRDSLRIDPAQTVTELGQVEQFDFLLGQAETSLNVTGSLLEEAQQNTVGDLSRVEERFRQRVDEIDTLNQEIGVARDAVEQITPDLLAQGAGQDNSFNQNNDEATFPDIDIRFQSTDDTASAQRQIEEKLAAIETSRDILGIFRAGLDTNIRGFSETRVTSDIRSENDAVLQAQAVRNQIQESAGLSLAGQANISPAAALQIS